MVTIRPITFTPASRPAQTRFIPTGAIQRPISYQAPEQQQSIRPAGLTQPTASSGGELTPDIIEARSQQVVNTRSAPYSHYVVQGGSWYGVRTVDGMEVRERLNPATSSTYPNPDYRYQTVGKGTPTFSEGSAGNVQIGASARPEAPGPGASKAAITAYGEAVASWEREQMWRGIDPSMSYQDIASAWEGIRFDVPTEERRAYEISSALLPAGTTAKQASIEAQYAAQRGTIVSSSGTLRPSTEGYRYSSGELFTPTPTGPAAAQGPTGISGPSLPSPAQMPGAGVGLIGAIAREKLGMDYISGGTMLTSALQQKKAPSVTGPLIPPETMQQARTFALGLPVVGTIWSAGEYIGLDYLLGVKIGEYNKEYKALESQGVIVGQEFKGSESQYNALNAKYQQIESIQGMQSVALDRTLGINLAEAQAGERWKIPGTQFEPSTAIYDFGHGLTTGATEQLGNLYRGGAGAAIEPIGTVAIGTVAAGMMIAGVSPQVLPHTLSFGKGFVKGIAAVPEFLGMAAVGAEGLAKYPQAIPGAAILGGYIQAKGIYEGVTTRPVEFAGEMYGTAVGLHAVGRVGYAASPIKYTSATFEARGLPDATYRGLYAESPVRGLKNLVLGGVEGLGTRQLGGLTSYEGEPWYRPTVSRGTPSHLLDYVGEGYPDYPALGVKIALTQERLTHEGNLPDLVSFRQELQTMDQLFRIRPSTIKNPFQEIQNIHGMTEEAGADFLTTLRDRFPTHRVGGSLGQAVQSRFSRAAADIDLYLPEEQIPAGRSFVTEWNRRHGLNIKVDIHEYPQPGSFIGRYGIRTEKDITVEGIHMMPIREQALRKLSQPMMLRNVEGAWRILPEAHRGKDIADTIGALQSEMYRLQESPASFLNRGRMRGLQESIDVQMGKMLPGALPVERIGGRTYDPSEAAAARYRQYRWDYAESPYVKIPGTRTYIDILQYDIFNRPIPIYQQLGIGPRTPWGIIFETGGKIRLHPEEIKMWEQMVIDESRGVIPPEDIRLFDKKGNLIVDFRKKRMFGSVDIKFKTRGAARANIASTHTHPLSPTEEKAYYLESETKISRFLDRFRKQEERWQPTYDLGGEKGKLIYRHSFEVPTHDAPLHTGDMWAGLAKGETTHVALTRDAVYVGRIRQTPRFDPEDVLLNDLSAGKLFEDAFIKYLKKAGGKLNEPERAGIAWKAYREAALRSAGKSYSKMGGMYKRYPIEEITNFADLSQEALSALKGARESTRTIDQFKFKTTKKPKWVRGLSNIDRSIFPEGTPTTNIRAAQEIPFGEYPSTFRPAKGIQAAPIAVYPSITKPSRALPSNFAYPAPILQGEQIISGIPSFITKGYPEHKQPGRRTTYPNFVVDVGKYPTSFKTTVPGYPGITKIIPEKYPGITKTGITPYPGITKIIPEKYPGITKTGITPYPGITKIIPEKYPGITKTGITPYPGITKIIPEKYPGVRITGGGGKTITGITTGGFGGFKIEEFITETTRQFIPKTTPAPITIPRRWLTLTEEKPKKKQGIRMAPDVLASAWNLESPIPRIRQAFGYNIGMPLAKSQRRNELAISNIQKSRIPTRYVWKMPFEHIRRINVPKVI